MHEVCQQDTNISPLLAVNVFLVTSELTKAYELAINHSIIYLNISCTIWTFPEHTTDSMLTLIQYITLVIELSMHSAKINDDDNSQNYVGAHGGWLSSNGTPSEMGG